MPKFSANLAYLFSELPFEERFGAAADFGFRAVEFPDPYSLDGQRLADLLGTNGLRQVLINSPRGNRDAGDRGLACLPGRENEFQDSIGLALDHAGALQCPRIHVLTGVPPAEADPDDVYRTYLDNLRFAARACGERGVKALIEPLNTKDNPGYYMNRSAFALQVIADAGVPNLFLQYDFYHAQIMEGDLARTLERVLPQVAHIQVADVPGRFEPGTGEINFPFLFKRMDDLGYQGWVGCEHRTTARTTQCLEWMKPYPQEPARWAAR